MNDPITIPWKKENSVADPVEKLLDQNLAQLGQTGIIAQNNFVTTTKAQDLDYLEGKRIVSLEEAIGVREVSSRQVPAGPELVKSA